MNSSCESVLLQNETMMCNKWQRSINWCIIHDRGSLNQPQRSCGAAFNALDSGWSSCRFEFRFRLYPLLYTLRDRVAQRLIRWIQDGVVAGLSSGSLHTPWSQGGRSVSSLSQGGCISVWSISSRSLVSVWSPDQCLVLLGETKSWDPVCSDLRTIKIPQRQKTLPWQMLMFLREALNSFEVPSSWTI